MSQKEVRVWDNRLLWREPSLTWNVQYVRPASRSICLPSMFLRKRTLLTLSWRKGISDACTGVLISMRSTVKGWDDELKAVEHMWMDRVAPGVARR